MEFTTGSGNVFADLGLAQPEDRLAKARVAYRIHEVIESSGLTQAQVARRTGLTQPNISDITRGKLKGFTLERLFQCLNALDQDVEIVIRPKQPDADIAGTFVLAAHNPNEGLEKTPPKPKNNHLSGWIKTLVGVASGWHQGHVVRISFPTTRRSRTGDQVVERRRKPSRQESHDTTSEEPASTFRHAATITVEHRVGKSARSRSHGHQKRPKR